jgi:hypothetical protein
VLAEAEGALLLVVADWLDADGVPLHAARASVVMAMASGDALYLIKTPR